MIRIAIALALMCTQASAFSSEPSLALRDGRYELAWDEGGHLRGYDLKFREIERSGLVVRVKAMCSSACTLVLRNPKACAEPKAVFGFHQARRVIKPGVEEYSDTATKLMWSEYPEMVRTKVGQLTPDLAYIKGTELLPECK